MCWSVSCWKKTVTVRAVIVHFISLSVIHYSGEFRPCCTGSITFVSPPLHKHGALSCLGLNWCRERFWTQGSVLQWELSEAWECIKTLFSFLSLPSVPSEYQFLTYFLSKCVCACIHICVCARLDEINAYALWLISSLAAVRGSHAKWM